MASDWSSIAFRNALCAMVRRRVPERDVEDVVQSTLVEALASQTRPEDPEAVRKWIWGIARNKVADYHRHAKRESFEAPDSVPAPTSDRQAADDLLRWAMRELPKEKDSQQTLEWLLREGDGDKLESIADGSNMPAPRVRQRVSRLRKHFRERWAADLAALAALGVVTVLLVMWWKKSREEPIARPDDSGSALPHELTPFERAQDERKRALAACDALQWQSCLDGLDRAKALDPAGDAAENVQNARKLAQDALTPAPAPTDAPTPIDSAIPSGSKLGPMPTATSPMTTSATVARPPKGKRGTAKPSSFSSDSSGMADISESSAPFASSFEPPSSSAPSPASSGKLAPRITK